MPKELTWSDAEDIGILLSETHPELDPLAIRFTDLHKYVIALPDFKVFIKPAASIALHLLLSMCVIGCLQQLTEALGFPWE
jgi:Fe-S-cluster formation regulator IscX/YfhJ